MDDEDEECTTENIPARLAFVLRRLTKSVFRLPGSIDRILLSSPQLMGFKTPSNGLGLWSFIKHRIGSPRKVVIAIAVLAFFTLLLSFWPLHDADWHRRTAAHGLYSSNGGILPRYWSATARDGSIEGATDFKKPSNLSVVGLVFYGRPAVVSVLDCYLKRNLKENGGLLDEVIFIARTKNYRDLAWLDALVDTTPSYRRHNISSFKIGDYRTAWRVVQNGTMYIKIDDDIVFFEDTTIPSLVETKLKHPEYFIVSANIMNQPSLSWVHYSMGAVLPFLPELKPPANFTYYDFNTNNITTIADSCNTTNLTDYDSYIPIPSDSWRPSELSTWTGPPNYKLDINNFTAPYNGHRWLPLPTTSNTTTNRTLELTLDDTPIYHSNFDAFGPSLYHWEIGAQQHYSFLTHLERNNLCAYKFQSWDYRYARLGIQFMAIMGDDVWRSMPLNKDDEYWFSEEMPRRLKRHAVVDGRAVAAHYSFEPQRVGMGRTDVLSRYRAFARENICV